MKYVRMTDKFFSGWGMAQGRKSVYVIACYTLAQAQAIAQAARKRPEMSGIKIQATCPTITAAQHVHIVDVGELSGPWLEFMPKSEFQGRDDYCLGDERYYAND